MTIEKKLEGNKLTVYLGGRVDTTIIPKLESEMPDLTGIENLIFDFENLEYISSAGLRFILKCKKTVKSTKVINCSPEVYEIFNVTGFSEMMEVQKAYRKISIDNCEKIGEGFYGIIYRIDPETIVKLYKIPDALDMIKRETELARKAFVMGIPTAIPYDIVKVRELYGAVFELLNAESVVKLINSEEALDDFAKKCVGILKDMHQKEVKEGELPSRKAVTIETLKECKEFFTEESYEKLLKLFNSIPERNTLLHSDFHVKNIMMQNGELLLIDMESLSMGHPIFEFASMFASYIAFSCVDKQNTDKFFGMPLDITTKLFNKIFRYYYDDKTEEELKDIETKLSLISYLQVLILRAKYKELAYGTEKEEIEFCVKYLTEKANELDTLAY
ncbi:MAG: phosphotransferase [Clostridia bacterium]|nr:phosphotransferase [Clostridia bacterium]